MIFVHLFFMEKNGKERNTTFFSLAINFCYSSFLLLSRGHFTEPVPSLPSCVLGDIAGWSGELSSWVTVWPQFLHNLIPKHHGRWMGGVWEVRATCYPSTISGFSSSSLTWEALRLEHGSPALRHTYVTLRVRPHLLCHYPSHSLMTEGSPNIRITGKSMAK